PPGGGPAGARFLDVADLVPADDCDRSLRLSRCHETRALSSGEHLLGIRELSGSGNDVRPGDSQRHIKVAVLQVELARTDVRLVIPTVNIVIDDHPRVPLRHLIERTVVSHASPTLRRDIEVPHRLNVDRCARCEWRREIDSHRVAVNRALGVRAADSERLEMSSTVESLAGEIEGGAEENERRLI